MAASPPSLRQSTSVSAELHSNRSFFTESIATPIKSSDGLILSSLDIHDENTATAEFVSDSRTIVGIHTFEIASGDKTALLSMSVTFPKKDAGIVHAEGNTASAGAYMGTLVLAGEDTDFDRFVSATVEGANGLEIVYKEVCNPYLIKLTYNVTLDQEPCEATIVVVDGFYEYRVPFTIVRPQLFESQAEEQTLIRGQVGYVRFYHPDAKFGYGSHIKEEDGIIETGDSVFSALKSTEVMIPVRVPHDFAENSLRLSSYTYSQENSMLQLVNTDVAIVDPGYIAFKPSRLPLDSKEVTLEMVAQGLDLTALESFEFEENTSYSLVNFQATDTGNATVTLNFGENIDERTLRPVASDGRQHTIGVVIMTDRVGQASVMAFRNIVQGDRVLLPIVVQDSDVTPNNIDFDPDDGIEIIKVTPIDDGSFMAEIEVDKDALPGVRNLNLKVGAKHYDANVEVELSSL